MSSPRSKLLQTLTTTLHPRPLLPLRLLSHHTPLRPPLPLHLLIYPPPPPLRHSSSSSTTADDPLAQRTKPYTFDEVRSLTKTTTTNNKNKATKTIIIDVREPSELLQTGRIPGAYSMPITSNPDAFYLSREDFFERFGFERPRARRRVGKESGGGMVEEEEGGGGKEDEEGEGEGVGYDEQEGEYGKDKGNANANAVDSVIFYCKAGVRSRAAARMAREWKGVRVGDMSGGWVEWEGRGGEVER